MSRSWLYRLGRLSAPHLLKAQWLWQSLAGSEVERRRAEYALGHVLANIYEREHAIDGNPGNAHLLEHIGTVLSGKLRNKKLRFRIRSVHVPELNAVALPGGFVYVAEPLIRALADDEDALAFLVAHEFAHVVKGHAGKRFINSLVLRLVSRHGVRGGPAAQLLAKLMEKGLQQGYSRHQEMEADRFAVHLSQAAKFNPEGGVRLMEKLRNAVHHENRGNPYFSSHPTFEERIAEINRLL